MILGLQDEIRRNPESRYNHRLHGLLLIAQGMSGLQVAQLLGDAPRTVQYWVWRFEQKGLAGLWDAERPGRPRRLNAHQLQAVEAALRQSPMEQGLSTNLWDDKTLSAWMEQRFGVHLGVRQCQYLFRQLIFRLRRPRPLIARADPERQRAHKKPQALSLDASVEFWALDEIHFQQYGLRCRMWIPPETRDPVLLHHPTRQSVGYFGEVCLQDGRFIHGREEDRFHAVSFWSFF